MGERDKSEIRRSVTFRMDAEDYFRLLSKREDLTLANTDVSVLEAVGESAGFREGKIDKVVDPNPPSMKVTPTDKAKRQ